MTQFMLFFLSETGSVMQNINPTTTNAWKALQDHFNKNKNRTIKDLFASDPQRFSKFSISFPKEDILVDYSKNIIDEETMKLLFDLARETKLSEAIDSMFTGEKINRTEGRAVLHTALRNRSKTEIFVDGEFRHYPLRQYKTQLGSFYF